MNLGVFTLLAADRAVNGHVVAFEPFLPTAERLQENVELSDPTARVDIVEIALWDEAGKTELGLDRLELGTQTPTLEPRSGQQTRTVIQAAGDNLVDEGFPVPTVLKVDVEGAEIPVLDGLEETLAACRLVFVEDHSTLWGGADAGDELRNRLGHLGFDIDVVTQGGQRYFRGEQLSIPQPECTRCGVDAVLSQHKNENCWRCPECAAILGRGIGA